MIAPAVSVIRFTLNGSSVEVAGPGGRRLLDVLRLDLGMTGTKEGCGEGECGACSVLLDGRLVASCLVPVCQVEGHEVLTVEGLGRDGLLDPLQRAFADAGAVQCGFCTPGMLMAARAFLDSDAEPGDDAIREALAGNLCRCTGYTGIVEAVRLAAADRGAGADRRASRPTGSHGMPGASRAPGRAATPTRAVPARSAGPTTLSPGSLSHALALLAEGGVHPIAGGTDVMVGLAQGTVDADTILLDLWGLDELHGIHIVDDAIVLGALTTYAELRRSPAVREHLPVLAEMAAMVGAAQIQNRGTLGGNIVNASPAGDAPPLLLALDADFVLGSVRRERTVPAAAFWTGYRTTARRADELLLRVVIPLVPDRGVRFRKVGTRRAQSIARVSVALAWRESDGTWRDVRIGLGSLAERPVRAPRTEAVLEGARPTAGTAELAAQTIAAEIHPIDDVRSTADYRRAVTARVLRRMVLEAGGPEQGGTGSLGRPR